jgi:hypothetical protein
MRRAGVRRKSIEDFANFIVAHPPAGSETSGAPESWLDTWATEIMPVANQALSRIEIGDPTHAENEERGPKCTWPVTFGRDYTAWANQQALIQVSKAGFRLAALVRAVLGAR